MKAFTLIVSLFIIVCAAIDAQNYQTVSSNRIAYFESEYGKIHCIRIDSVYTDKDSVLFPLNQIRELDEYECFTPFGDSWIGGKIIIKEDGTNLWLNKNHDTISIKTKAKLNEEWIAFNIVDSLSIKAKVVDHDTVQFLGLIDSVKTIDLLAYDKNLNPIKINGMDKLPLKISKNHGIIQTFDVYYFLVPERGYNYIDEYHERYNLVGLSHPEVGIHNLSRLDIYNFNIGDEIHIIDQTYNEGYINDNKLIIKYISKVTETYSIKYRIIYIQSQYLKNYDEGKSFKYIYDTITQTIKPDSIFDNFLPNEPIITDNLTANTFSMFSNNTKVEPSPFTEIYKAGDECWSNCCYDGCVSDNTFIKGLGGPYYYCEYFFGIGHSERKLVYYKKGDVEWGTPLVITAIDEKQSNEAFSIYPNPAKKQITIKTSNQGSKLYFKLYDLNGIILLEKALNLNNTNLNISFMKNGVYLYTILQNDHKLKTGKLFIAR